ncbi:RuvB-like 2 [Glycine soja]|uniref:RuvB-like helicase n=1 Tax=Glycine soja TaxID=3848 RepID=A0A0B2SS28_GLYSO|nr:RuvB-like 2 [Glycine soja]
MVELKLSESRDLTSIEHVGMDSHILDLDSSLESHAISDDMVGQIATCMAASVILQMIKDRKIASHTVFLPGTGKTAIAMGMAKSLELETPFTMITASEIFSLEMWKTKALTQAFHKAINIGIKEETKVVEVQIDHPAVADAIVKTGKLMLKSTWMETYQMSCFKGKRVHILGMRRKLSMSMQLTTL